MKIKTGNLWNELGKADLICITTNSAIKRSGELVMGAGIAKEAARRFPALPLEAGRMIEQEGLTLGAYFFLPVKTCPPMALFQTKYHFSEDSNPYLFQEAAYSLARHAEELKEKLGRPAQDSSQFPRHRPGQIVRK